MKVSQEDMKKAMEAVGKVGLPVMILVTVSYFVTLFLIPIGILSTIVWLFQVPIQSQMMLILSAIVFIGYFVVDIYRVMDGKYNLTIAVLMGIMVFGLVVSWIFHSGAKAIQMDATTPSRIKNRVFPLNIMC